MSENFAHAGVWGVAAIMIAAASWFLYRYLAPKSWREWAGAGLVQAFLIALYAETYGSSNAPLQRRMRTNEPGSSASTLI